MNKKTGRPAKTEAQHAADAGVSVSTWRRRKKDQGMTPAAGELREQKLAEEVRKLRAEADAREKYMEMFDLEYLPRETIEQEQAKISHICNALVRAVSSELPALVEGMNAADIEKKCKEWAVGWSDRLADADGALWEAAEAEVTKSALKGDLKKAATAKRKRDE